MFGRRTSKNSKSHPLLSLFLVVIESALALVLRFDKRLRQALFPLVQEDLLLCVRTYLPHVLVYASFTKDGILLDTKPPQDRSPQGATSARGDTQDNPEDVLVSGSTLAFLRLFLASDDSMLDKLQFRGNRHLIELCKNAMSKIQLGHIFGDLLNNFRKLDDEQSKTKVSLGLYKKQLNEQQDMINQLNLALHESEAALKHQLKYERRLHIALILLVLALVIVSIYAIFF